MFEQGDFKFPNLHLVSNTKCCTLKPNLLRRSYIKVFTSILKTQNNFSKADVLLLKGVLEARPFCNAWIPMSLLTHSPLQLMQLQRQQDLQ